MKVQVGRGAACMIATEHQGRDVTQSALRVEAWEECLQNDTSNPEQKHMLMDILEGLPSRPHEWPNLAAKGYNQ